MNDKYDDFKKQIDMLIDDMRDGAQRINEAQKSVQTLINNIKTSNDVTEIEKIGLAAHAVREVGKVINNDLYNR